MDLVFLAFVLRASTQAFYLQRTKTFYTHDCVYMFINSLCIPSMSRRILLNVLAVMKFFVSVLYEGLTLA
jgi:hypothetical protein